MTLEDRLAQADAEFDEWERLRKEYDLRQSDMTAAAYHLAELLADGDDAHYVEKATARYRNARAAHEKARDAYLGEPA